MAFADILVGLAKRGREHKISLLDMEHEDNVQQARIFAQLAESENYEPEQRQKFLEQSIGMLTDPSKFKKTGIKNGMVQIPVRDMLRPSKPLASAEAAELKPGENIELPLAMKPPTFLPQAPAAAKAIESAGPELLRKGQIPIPEGIGEISAPATMPGGLASKQPRNIRTMPGSASSDILLPPAAPPPQWTPIGQPISPQTQAFRKNQAAEDALRRQLELRKEFEGVGPEETAVLSPGQTLVGKQSGRTVASVPVRPEQAKGNFVAMTNGQILNRDTGEVSGEPKEADDKWMSLGNGEIINTKTHEILTGSEKASTDAIFRIREFDDGVWSIDKDGTKVKKVGNAPKSESRGGGITDNQSNQAFLRISDKFQADPIMKVSTRGAVAKAMADQVIANPGSATNQLAALYLYVKNLDPDSAVREGEIDLASKTQSYFEQFKASLTRLAEGQVLGSTAAKDLAQATKSLIGAWDAAAAKRTQQYRSQANVAKVGKEFEQYLKDFDSSGAGGGGASSGENVIEWEKGPDGKPRPKKK